MVPTAVIPSDLPQFEGHTMPWTETTRPHYARSGLHYATDLTDAEWGLIEPRVLPAKLRARPCTCLRAVTGALLHILHILSTGCQWRQHPKGFPPYSTVQVHCYRWSDDGTWERINRVSVMGSPERIGRDPSPSGEAIDSQSVKTTESGCLGGYDAGKKVKGRKRHIVIDTVGHLLGLQVHTADIHDRDAAVGLLSLIGLLYPWLRHIFAAAGYAGEKLRGRLARLRRWVIEIMKRPDGISGFQVLAKRWVVERTLAWLGRCRSVARDFEASISSATAWVLIAHIRLLARRLARG